jgi:hypothetical protein
MYNLFITKPFKESKHDKASTFHIGCVLIVVLYEEQTTKQLRQVLNHHTPVWSSYDTHVKTYL